MTKFLIALVLALSLTACDAPAPGEGQAVQQASSSHSTGDMLMGGFLGYMLGRSSSTPSSSHVVEHHYHPAPEKQTVATDYPKLHQGQNVVKPPVPAAPASVPKTNQYATASAGVG